MYIIKTVYVHKLGLCAHKLCFMYINIVYVHFCANGVVVIVPGGVIIVAMTILCRVMLESIDGLYLL